MNGREQGVIYQAVMFFDADILVKEMLQVEFEAVLDQVVGLPEFAGREIRACFLRINSRLQVVGAVFFLVDFDLRGYVNRSWNVPLLHLVDNAGRGPDLGAGRIRLACRSQCSVPWHARQLWDPILDGEAGSFRQMQQALRRNRLGLPEEEPAAIAAPLLNVGAMADEPSPREASEPAVVDRRRVERIGRRLQREYRSRLSALEEEQRLQMATLRSAAQEQLEQANQHHQIQLGRLQATLDSTRQLFIEEKRRSQQLKERLAAQVAEFQQVRREVQHEIAQEQGLERAKLQQLQQQFDAELKARVEQARAELKEMLDMREVELFYREEQLGNLREEVSRLRQERERLLSHSGDHLLQRLVENGVTFVAYQPGLEALNIAAADMARYLDSPSDYIAEKCFVTPELYRQWLEHYHLPVCMAPLEHGSVCGQPLVKIERPGLFLAGDSDRCAVHRATAASMLEPALAPMAEGPECSR